MKSSLKVYLDNNVVSAIARDDTPSESYSLDVLLSAYEHGKVELVTSEVTLDEIKRYFGRERKVVERTFRLLKKVLVVRWDELIGMNVYGDRYTWINSPIIQNDRMYDDLLKLGLDTTDAQHLFVATKTACAIFLTCDSQVLAKAAGIHKLCGLELLKPSEFVAGQGWQS
jgi:predicted nucleic acid-binding protein